MKLISRITVFFITLFLVNTEYSTISANGADDHGDDIPSATILSVVASEDVDDDLEDSYAGGTIDSADDADFFGVEIADNCFLTIFFYSTEVTKISLLDQSGEIIISTQGIPGKLNEHNSNEYDQLVIDRIGLTPGRYYIRLEVEELFPIYYAIALQADKLIENHDDHGNSLAEASSVQKNILNDSCSGCLESSIDVDFFSFEVADFHYSCPNRDNFDFIDFTLIDDMNNTIATGALFEFDTVSLGLEPGNYYLSLTSNNGSRGCYSVCTSRNSFFQPGGMASGVIFPPDAHAEITLFQRDEFIGDLIYRTDTARWGNSGAWWMTCGAGTYEMTIEADSYETIKKEVHIDYGTETQTGSVMLKPSEQNNCQESINAVIGLNLDLFFPCIIVGEEGYSLTLKSETDPYQFDGFIWSLDMNSLTYLCTGCNERDCIRLREDLTISVPCAKYQEATYGFDLKFDQSSCDSGLICWQLDLASFH